MYEISLLKIFLISVLQFVVGAIWYSALFGREWGKIMEFEKHTKAEQDKMAKEMGPYYGIQFGITVLLNVGMALFARHIPDSMSIFMVAFFIWLFFVVPTQISGVIWANTKKKFWGLQLSIMATCQLVCLLVAALVMSWWR